MGLLGKSVEEEQIRQVLIAPIEIPERETVDDDAPVSRRRPVDYFEPGTKRGGDSVVYPPGFPGGAAA